MYKTVNNTTTKVDYCSATVIAATTFCDAKILTYELVYPRFIHSELMTHRAFSRNAASSRATPTSRLCQEASINPAFFSFVGKNCKGMVTNVPLDPETLNRFKAEWEDLGKHVAAVVKHWSDDYGIHKQTANRALEPWLYIRTLVTATDWDNFFQLRLADDAQPEMRSLAEAMALSAAKAELIECPWHIPYVALTEHTKADELPELVTRSVAACARVSVLRGDEKKTTAEEDLKFVQGLLKAKHMSPFEHVAMTTGGEMEYAFNLYGWQSLRYMLANGLEFSDIFEGLVTGYGAKA